MYTNVRTAKIDFSERSKVVSPKKWWFFAKTTSKLPICGIFCVRRRKFGAKNRANPHILCCAIAKSDPFLYDLYIYGLKFD